MPLVNAKCTNCGAPLQVDNSHEAAVCPYCNSAYIVEKAIQNFNYHITNNITAQNVIIAGKGEMEKERLLQNAQTNENFKEYDKAFEIYSQVAEDYPDDYRGWFGMASLLTSNFTKINKSNQNLVDNYLNKAMICAKTNSVDRIVNELNKYKEFIRSTSSQLEELNSNTKTLNDEINSIENSIKQNEKANNEIEQSITLKKSNTKNTKCIICFSILTVFSLVMTISDIINKKVNTKYEFFIPAVFGLITLYFVYSFFSLKSVQNKLHQEVHNTESNNLELRNKIKLLEKEKSENESKIEEFKERYFIELSF